MRGITFFAGATAPRSTKSTLAMLRRVNQYVTSQYEVRQRRKTAAASLWEQTSKGALAYNVAYSFANVSHSGASFTQTLTCDSFTDFGIDRMVRKNRQRRQGWRSVPL
jgi:hypothetical protein